MASPEVSSNPTEFQKVARAAADLEQAVTAYREYEQLQQELAEAKELAAESAGNDHLTFSCVILDACKPHTPVLKTLNMQFAEMY